MPIPAPLRQLPCRHPLLLILLLGFLLRLAFFIELRQSPFYSTPDLDALEYDNQARDFAAGKLAWTEIPIHGPGYPLFLALLYTLFRGSYTAVYAAQFSLGLLNAYLVYRLGRRFFDRAAALVAAFFMATLWTTLYFEGLLLATTLMLTLDLLALLALDHARRPGRPWSWLLAGILLGLSAITWPLILAFLGALLLMLLFFPPSPLRRPAFAPAGLLLLGAALPIAPVTWQNWRAEHDFVLIQKNGGMNLYLGNNASADGTPNVRPTGEWDQLLLLPQVEAGITKQSQRDRFFLALVLHFARTQPGRFLQLQARKLALLLNAREIRATFDPEFFRRRYRTLSLPLPGFALILALGLLGMVRARNPFPSLLFFYLAAYAAAVVLTVVSARYRMPLAPVLALFAGHGLVELARLLRERDWRRLAPALVFLGAVDLAGHWSRLVPKHTNAEEWSHLGNAYYVRRNLYPAELAFRRALEEEPGYSLAMTGLAVISWDQGRRDRALETLRRALLLDPENVPTRFQYAEYLRQQGEWDKALAEYQILLQKWPAQVSAHFFIALTAFEKGDLDSARREAEEVLRLRPENAAMLDLLKKIQDHERETSP